MKTKTLAEVYLKQGHLQEAYEILKALAEKDPRDLEIRERLKELSEKLGVAPPSIAQSVRLREKRLQTLGTWLMNIQNRRKK
ncbi:MAG TPA: tetratricopeptide repeat protein [Thermodesulfobacteriota bacterium]|nr:tetratricopeptide repeat protein [Thermodesulfobacteriota bacterium]